MYDRTDSLDGEFVWDLRKEVANRRKHGIAFVEATEVFFDENAMRLLDRMNGEERWITIGLDAVGRILVVVWAADREKVRLISARKATARERSQYLGRR